MSMRVEEEVLNDIYCLFTSVVNRVYDDLASIEEPDAGGGYNDAFHSILIYSSLVHANSSCKCHGCDAPATCWVVSDLDRSRSSPHNRSDRSTSPWRAAPTRATGNRDPRST